MAATRLDFDHFVSPALPVQDLEFSLASMRPPHAELVWPRPAFLQTRMTTWILAT